MIKLLLLSFFVLSLRVDPSWASRPSRFLGFSCSSKFRSSQWITGAQDESVRARYNAQGLEGECPDFDPTTPLVIEVDECVLSEDTTMYRGCDLEAQCFVGQFDNSAPQMARMWTKYAEEKLAAAIHGFQDAGCLGHNTAEFKQATADACCAQVILEALNEELCEESAWNTEVLEHTLYPENIGFATLAYEDDATTDVDYNDFAVRMRSVKTLAPAIAPQRELSEIIYLEPTARGSKRQESFLFVHSTDLPALFDESAGLLNPAGDFNVSSSECYEDPNEAGVGNSIEPRITGIASAVWTLYTPTDVGEGTINTTTVILYADTMTPMPVNQDPPVLGPNDPFTNTIQRANYQESQANYVLSLFYDVDAFDNETSLPEAPGASSYPGYRFILRDLQDCVDLDLIDVDPTAVYDDPNMPRGVVAAPSDCPYAWPLEGRPVDTVALGGPRCIGGEEAGASCDPVQDECPFGLCELEALSCFGSNSTHPALGLQDPFEAPCEFESQCPYGFCYDGHGAYPDFTVYYEMCLDDNGPLESTICQTNPFDLRGADADEILYVRP